MTQSARRVRVPRYSTPPQRFPSPDPSIDALAEHCLAAREIIGERGSPVMKRLIDLLLLEVGEMAAGDNRGRTEPRAHLADA